MKTILFRRVRTLLWSTISIMFAHFSFGQTTIGTIQGILQKWNPDGPSIVVQLREISTSTLVGTSSPDRSGHFTFRNIQFATYDVEIVDHDIVTMQRRVTVNSTVPVVVSFDSLREYTMSEITIEASQYDLVSLASQTATHSFYTRETIDQLPSATQNKAIESVLLSTPGVVPDEDGRMHVRGEDAQLQYVIDGIPVTGNLTRVYSSLFNASLVKSMDIQTGGLSAEYGIATSGIIDVTTKSGFDRPLFARASGSAGSFNTREAQGELGGGIGSTAAAYIAASTTSSDRYLDPVTSGSPNHDNGNARSFFGKFNAFLGSTDLAVIGMYNSTRYSVPNLFQRTPAQDQQQDLHDYLIGGRINVALNETSGFTVLGYTRQSRAKITSGGLMQLAPADYQSAITQNERFFVGGNRTYTTTGGRLEFASHPDWFSLPNTFKAGIAGDVTPVKEFFTFAVTDSNLSTPPDSTSVGGDDRYEPYDLTRGGTPFLVNASKTGYRLSGYVQDEVRYNQWRFNLGVRFDVFSLVETESAISPRVGASFMLNDNLVLRLSYNRIVMQAPLENYLVSSSPEAAALVGVGGPDQGNVPTHVRSEKAHVLELGGSYQMNRFFDFDLSGYGKFIDDFIVKVELGNSGVIFPVNLKKGIVAGGELRVRLRQWNDFSGFLSFSTCVSRGLVPDDGSTPFAAGLVLGEEGESYSNPFKGEDSFPTEHNQLLTASFGITYQHRSGLFATIGGRFDSGLPFDLEGPQGQPLDEAQSRQELLRRGYTDDVIKLLDLAPETAGSPDRSVAPHAVFDVSGGCNFLSLSRIPVKLTLTVLNIFDTAYLYKFESSFGGTHFGVPRTFTARVDLTY